MTIASSAVRSNLFPAVKTSRLRKAKSLREDADYYGRWSQAACENLLKSAEEFLAGAEDIIKGKTV
jgi:hypothetical protein